MICQNQILCLTCGDKPYSANRHDFKYCKCGAIAVDGGMSYLRRVGDMTSYKDLSYSMDDKIVEDCAKEVSEMLETGRNNLGVVLGVFRVLFHHQRLVTDRGAGLE